MSPQAAEVFVAGFVAGPVGIVVDYASVIDYGGVVTDPGKLTFMHFEPFGIGGLGVSVAFLVFGRGQP